MKVILIGVVVVIVMLVLFQSFVIMPINKTEERKNSLVHKYKDFEIRYYPSATIATINSNAKTFRDLSGPGFQRLAGYIFGGNVQKQSIAMTAPVIARKDASEKIAMTAPVVASKEGDMQVISFGMPSSYSLSTLPMPTDPNVKLVEIPEEKVAVVTSSWYRTDSRVQNMEKELLSFLTRDGIKTVGPFSYAGYNAPWTPPWMLRNEVMIQIQ